MGDDIVAVTDAIGAGAGRNIQLVQARRAVVGVEPGGVWGSESPRDVLVAEDGFCLRAVAIELEIESPNPEPVSDGAAAGRGFQCRGLGRKGVVRLVGFDNLKTPASPTMGHRFDIRLVVTIVDADSEQLQ